MLNTVQQLMWILLVIEFHWCKYSLNKRLMVPCIVNCGTKILWHFLFLNLPWNVFTAYSSICKPMLAVPSFIVVHNIYPAHFHYRVGLHDSCNNMKPDFFSLGIEITILSLDFYLINTHLLPWGFLRDYLNTQ